MKILFYPTPGPILTIRNKLGLRIFSSIFYYFFLLEIILFGIEGKNLLTCALWCINFYTSKKKSADIDLIHGIGSHMSHHIS